MGLNSSKEEVGVLNSFLKKKGGGTNPEKVSLLLSVSNLS
jgi:hypothetical protein